LEALEPHSGLKSFGVKSYGGAHFPLWMRNTSILKGLVHIILYDCKNCKKLPPLGKLPCLTTLYVCGMRDLKYIDDALYEPATEKAFTSLKKLTLCDLPNLEGVLKVEGVEMLPELSNLSISCVPKLVLPSLPSVEILSAHGGTEVVLKFTSYMNCDEDLASSPRGIVGNTMYNLKSLYISDFAKLKELPDELGTLCVLEHLHIQFCDEIESFLENLLQGLSSLRTLTIHYCHGFKSLSGGIKHLTCLERLQITYCPQFIFPHNMNSQTALRQLKVSGHSENILDSLEGIPSLQNLSLTYFLSMRSLPDWLGAITSLQELEINRFPKLSSLPDSFQQLRNLKKLSITSCSKLETRCEKGIGEDWHNIAHIPELELEDNLDAKPTFRGNLI
jgi:Leucine-rich repeat (LRR) protein